MSHQILLSSDGTRIDIGDGRYDYPVSIDLKITDYCATGCPWCHESSGKGGRHADVDKILDHLKFLPPGVEIALGGGNPLSHPELSRLVSSLKGLGFIVNMTVRDSDIVEDIDYVTGLGISITPSSAIDYLGKLSSNNLVAHMILGINSISDYRRVKEKFSRILWLGFKIWGRNRNSVLPDLTEIRREIVQDLYTGRNLVLAFDNLAITQLDLRSSFLKKEWESFYLGNEFTSTMYVDAVRGEYAGYSISPDRISWDDLNILEYYVKYSQKV